MGLFPKYPEYCNRKYRTPAHNFENISDIHKKNRSGNIEYLRNNPNLGVGNIKDCGCLLFTVNGIKIVQINLAYLMF